MSLVTTVTIGRFIMDSRNVLTDFHALYLAANAEDPRRFPLDRRPKEWIMMLEARQPLHVGYFL